MWGAVAAVAGALVLAGSVVTAIVLGRNARHESETREAGDQADGTSGGKLADPGRIRVTNRYAGLPETIETDQQVVTWSYAFGYEDVQKGVPDPGRLAPRVEHVFGPKASQLTIHQRVVCQAGYKWGRTDATDNVAQKSASEVWAAWGSI